MRRSAAAVLATGAAFAFAATTLSPVVAPTENPASEAKRVLGKILFWDEQLSADDTISCGSCHFPDDGGADPRRARHPGPDGLFGTPDDVFGSAGVVHQDAAGNYAPHAVFGLDVQVTGRNAPSFLTGALADSLFWDGRASGQFVDPQTGLVAVAAGGALESQAVGPVLNPTEMGREGRTWDDVAAKLATAAPLALSSGVPPDVAAVLTDATRYPDLFAAAFGDGAVTSSRIAFAIATYERTLVPDQTPWDRYQAGETTALNAAQIRGLGAFQASHCADCHKPPEFTDRDFHAIGLRPPGDDVGRQTVTGVAADRGKFRTPSLRNVNLRASHMHTGQFTTLPDVLRFYARAPGAAPQFQDNVDPIVKQIQLPPPAAGDIQALLETGLTDPRSAAKEFPFDYPTPYSVHRVHGPMVFGAGVAGSGGIAPRIVAVTPPYLGNAEFKIGVGGAQGGASAYLAVSSSDPTLGRLAPEKLFGPVALSGVGAGAGYATMTWPLPDDASRDGERVWFQWRVADAAAPGGVALSDVAAVTLFAVKSTAAGKPVVTDDASLYVGAADFSVDWRRHATDVDGDSISVRGVLHLGAAASVDGETFVVSLAGAELLRATLDPHGRARSAPRATPSWSAQVDAATGRFTVAVSGVDLRTATGLDPFAGSGTLHRDVGLSVGATSADATVPFAWTTTAGRLSRGAHRFAKDGLVSGAFVARRARVRGAAGGAQSLRVDGSLDAAGAADAAPTGDVDVRVGGDVWTLPASSRTARGATVQYASRGAMGAPSIRFTYFGRSRTFTLTVDGLAPTLLPDGALSASLPVGLTTSDGRNVFTTNVPLRRASAASRTWTR